MLNISNIKLAFKGKSSNDIKVAAKPKDDLIHEIKKFFLSLFSSITGSADAGEKYEKDIIASNENRIKGAIQKVCTELPKAFQNLYIDDNLQYNNVIPNNGDNKIIKLNGNGIFQNNKKAKYINVGTIIKIIDNGGTKHFLQKISYNKYQILTKKDGIGDSEIASKIQDGESCTKIFTDYDPKIPIGVCAVEGDFAIIMYDAKICIAPIEESPVFGKVISQKQELLAQWDGNETTYKTIVNQLNQVVDTAISTSTRVLQKYIRKKAQIEAIRYGVLNNCKNYIEEPTSSKSTILYTNKYDGYQLVQDQEAIKLYPLELDEHGNIKESVAEILKDKYVVVKTIHNQSSIDRFKTEVGDSAKFIQDNILSLVVNLKEMVFNARETDAIQKSLENILPYGQLKGNEYKAFYINVYAGYQLVQFATDIKICNVAVDEQQAHINAVDDPDIVFGIKMQIYILKSKKDIDNFKRCVLKTQEFVNNILLRLTKFKNLHIHKQDKQSEIPTIYTSRNEPLGFKLPDGSIIPKPNKVIINGPSGGCKILTGITTLPENSSLTPQVELTLNTERDVTSYDPLSEYVQDILETVKADCFILGYRVNQNTIVTEDLGEHDIAKQIKLGKVISFNVEYYFRLIRQVFILFNKFQIFQSDIKLQNVFFNPKINSMVFVDNDGNNLMKLGEVESPDITYAIFPWYKVVNMTLVDFYNAMYRGNSMIQNNKKLIVEQVYIRLKDQAFVKKFITYNLLSIMIMHYHKTKLSDYNSNKRFDQNYIDGFVSNVIPQDYRTIITNFLFNCPTGDAPDICEVFGIDLEANLDS